ADVPLKKWQYIVLHHTASTSGSVTTIHAEHQQRKDSDGNNWRGIGYHFVIGNGNGMPDGLIEPTFRWHDQSSGAHAGVGLYNEFGIGICLIGNFDETPPTPRQLAAVKQIVAALKQTCVIETSGVVRHGDVKATACPGKLFPFDEVAATPPDVAGLRPRYPAW
ncbi:MAG: N-acetylmuramoyl-L-alanine amidase, partial [Planctomycetaceae bacterium]|nr:N-acetylmuramoyl-L-alanine amidase [Planctomycetaceae bacterium]